MNIDPPPISDEEAIRLATVLDCEGYIGIVRANPNKHHAGFAYSIRIGVGMTTTEYPFWFHNRFGGTLRKRQGRGKNWKPQWDWTISGQKAMKVLEVLGRYVYVKHEQVLTCRVFNEVREKFGRKAAHFRVTPQDVLRMYETCYQYCKQLNERGKPVGEKLQSWGSIVCKINRGTDDRNRDPEIVTGR